jgi:hypothetical protein
MEKVKKDESRAGGISTLRLHKDKRDRVIPKRAPLKPESEEHKRMYKTLIRNENPELVAKIPLPDNYPQRWAYVHPKKDLVIKFSDDSYILAPYIKVTYGKKDHQVSLQKRKGFEQKFPDYTCVFLNEASHLYLEVYPSDDNRPPIFMPKGIPVRRTFAATSNWAEYKSVTILKPNVVEVMSLSHPGSTELELRPNIKKVKHPQKILDRILKERKESALRSFGLNK